MQPGLVSSRQETSGSWGKGLTSELGAKVRSEADKPGLKGRWHGCLLPGRGRAGGKALGHRRKATFSARTACSGLVVLMSVVLMHSLRKNNVFTSRKKLQRPGLHNMEHRWNSRRPGLPERVSRYFSSWLFFFNPHPSSPPPSTSPNGREPRARITQTVLNWRLCRAMKTLWIRI